MAWKMYILVVNFQEGLKYLNPCRLAVKSSFRDTIQVSVLFMLTLHKGIVLQKHASGTNSRQDEKTR